MRLIRWWVLLFGLWVLFAGTWSAWIACFGAVLALCGAALAVGIARVGLLETGIRARWLLSWRPLSVFTGFWSLTAGLVRGIRSGRHTAGRFRSEPGPRRSDGRRAWIELTGSWSPESYVIDVSADTGEIMSHVLARRQSR